jgi:hypothetical protein
MGEWPVTDIMDEGRADDQLPFIRREHQLPCHDISKIHGPKGVFEAGMIGTWIHEEGKSELPDIAKPLDCRSIEDRKCITRYLNVAMNRVLDDLHLATYTVLISA